MSAVTMFAAVGGVGGGVELFKVEGQRVDFDFVAHPFIVGEPGNHSLADDGRVSISDPITGARIVWGGSMEKALYNLETGIQLQGGREQFEKALAFRRAAFRTKHGQGINEEVAA